MYAKIDYSDGIYAMVVSKTWEPGMTHSDGWFEVDPYLVKAYFAHLDHDKAWQRMLREMDDAT